MRENGRMAFVLRGDNAMIEQTTVDGRAITRGQLTQIGLDVGAASRCGDLHETNEDSTAIGRRRDLFVVCDGIGGAPKGDLFSRVATNVIVDAFDAGARLANAVGEADEAVRSLGSWLRLRGAGCTVVAACVFGATLHVFWGGDSKAYVLRGGVFEDLTPSDRLVDSKVLSNYLGGDVRLQLHDNTADLKQGDCVILCSDGVWSHTGRGEIMALFGDRRLTAPELAYSLVFELGERRDDDASAIVVRVV